MHTRIGRWLLPVLLLAAGAGAVAWTWSLARHVERLEHAARETSARIDRVDDLLDRFSSQELTYTASGFTDVATVAAASDQLKQVLLDNSTILTQSLAATAPPAGAITETSAAIATILDRVRENLDAGLDVMAADLVFTETADARRAMRGHLRALRSAEVDELVDARAADLTQAWAALAGMAVLVVLALVLSTRVRRGADVTVPEVSPSTRVSEDQALAQPAALHVDLIAAAELCTAIGRLDTEDRLQGLLEQTGRLLGAPGVVVWMAGGEELFPVAAHGYALDQLNRLGPISRSAVNATAAAWRTEQLQTVTAGSASRAAIVAPMLGPERCVGVLAVEVDPDRETEGPVQAVTAMIAAQLAAVLTPWPAASTSSPADVLPFDRAANASS